MGLGALVRRGFLTAICAHAKTARYQGLREAEPLGWYSLSP